MSVIATAIERDGVARIFFNCRRADADPRDEARIAKAIARAAAAMASADVKGPRLPQAA
jgi:hypothetical protein